MEIRFGSPELDINGIPPDPEKGRVSQRDAEKIILISILEQAINAFPDVQDLVAINRLINMIRKSDESIDATSHDIQIIVTTYKMLKERPINWVYYGDLFSQIVSAMNRECASDTEITRK